MLTRNSCNLLWFQLQIQSSTIANPVPVRTPPPVYLTVVAYLA